MQISEEQLLQSAETLLGSLYVKPDLGPSVTARLPTPAALPDEAHAAYKAMLEYGLAEGELNIAFFKAATKGDPFTTRFTHADAVAINQASATNESVTKAAKVIQDRHQNLKLRSQLARMGDEVEDNTGLPLAHNASAALATLQAVLSASDEETDDGTMESAVREFGKIMDSWETGEDPSYVPTHFPGLDRMLHGYRRSHFALICGFSSGGKSSFMVDSLVRFGLSAIETGNTNPAIAFSCEMPATALVERMISNITGISSAKFRPNAEYPASEGEWARYREALDTLAQFPIIIKAQSAPTLEFIRSTIAEVKAKYGGVETVWVDYLEKVFARGEGEARVSAISEGLTAIFKDYDVAGVVFSQYNRTGQDKGAYSTPQNTWIRGSGKPEQEAYQIIHISWNGYFKERGATPEHFLGKSPNDICLFATKNRGGAIGNVWVRMDPSTQRWLDQEDFGYAISGGGKPRELQSVAEKYSL